MTIGLTLFFYKIKLKIMLSENRDMARVDSCFQSQRKYQDNVNDKTYWYDLPKSRDLNFRKQLDYDTIQYTSTRVKNSDFNPAFYGKSNRIALRRDMIEELESKQHPNNPYPSLSLEEQYTMIPRAMCGRNATRLTDPKSINNGMGNMDKRLNKLTAEQLAKSKVPMLQPSGKVIW